MRNCILLIFREHMLEKKYFATWRIHARVRKHHRDNMGDIESSDGGGGHYGAIEGGGEQQGEGIEMHKMQNGSVGGDAQKKEKTEGEREGEGTSSEKESRSLVMLKSLALLTTGENKHAVGVLNRQRLFRITSRYLLCFPKVFL